jgi:hypothetical protein
VPPNPLNFLECILEDIFNKTGAEYVNGLLEKIERKVERKGIYATRYYIRCKYVS